MELKSKKLKIAIIHDILVSKGGAESVLESLIKAFPGANIYTGIYHKSSAFSGIRKGIKKTYPKSVFVSEYKLLSKLLIFNYWESLDLTGYDIVISSSDEFSCKSVITKPETLHICYCHTPPRYLYPEYPDFTKIKSLFPLGRKLILSFLRQKDFIGAQRPDIFVANSITVKGRIMKYYKRSSVLIYPPVKVPKTEPTNRKVSDYYLYVGSLEERKGIELCIKVFNASGKKLIIIGKGRDSERLRDMGNKNITFLGYVSDLEKENYLKKARGFLAPNIDEDFGIAPVEAMSFGVPVIAYFSGGLRETVISGKTGVFFYERTEKSLSRAISDFEKTKFNSLTCYNQASLFSEAKFISNVKQLVYDNYKKLQQY